MMTLKKKILLVSGSFYPEISPRSYRATELAKEFCRQGHEVTVISKYRDHDYTDFLNEFKIKIKMWGKSSYPEIPQSAKKPFSFFYRILSRALLTLFEYPEIESMFKAKRMLKNENGYSLLISFAVPYPVHWGVAWSRSEKNRIAETWVADCGDPYMGDVLDSFRKPFYFKYFEKSFCRKADFISIPIASAMPGYYAEFHHKIRVIPQGFDFDLNCQRNKELVNEIPTFAYAGGFLHGTRDPGQLMAYLISITSPFRFLIYTNNPNAFDEYKEKLNDKLLISNYIPRDDLMNKLPKVDFLINFDNNTSLNSPSKLIDYVIVGRPVINIRQDFNAEDFRAFLNGDYSKKMQLPDPANYHISNISGLFLNLLS